jgi:hypothetical protein
MLEFISPDAFYGHFSIGRIVVYFVSIIFLYHLIIVNPVRGLPPPPPPFQTHIYIYIYIYVHMHIQIHTYKYKHTNVYIYIHIHIQRPSTAAPSFSNPSPATSFSSSYERPLSTSLSSRYLNFCVHYLCHIG